MTLFKLSFCLIFALMLSSCSTMKSGHYVQVKPNDTIDTLSKEFNVPTEAIKESNTGRSISSGAWVFIPLRRGVINQDLKTHAQDPDHMIKSGEFLWPVPSSSRVSSHFGKRWGRLHQGIDIAGRIGAHIVAAADGVVVYEGDEMGGYGIITVIAHKNGYFTVYSHAKKNFTKKGQRVYRGQVIAQVGMTGRTTGPHLHFEVRKNGRPVDPSKFLAAAE